MRCSSVLFCSFPSSSLFLHEVVGPHGPSLLFKTSVCANRPGDLYTCSIRVARHLGESMKMCEREGPCSVHRNAMGTTPLCLLHLLIAGASLPSLRVWVGALHFLAARASFLCLLSFCLPFPLEPALSGLHGRCLRAQRPPRSPLQTATFKRVAETGPRLANVVGKGRLSLADFLPEAQK